MPTPWTPEHPMPNLCPTMVDYGADNTFQHILITPQRDRMTAYPTCWTEQGAEEGTVPCGKPCSPDQSASFWAKVSDSKSLFPISMTFAVSGPPSEQISDDLWERLVHIDTSPENYGALHVSSFYDDVCEKSTVERKGVPMVQKASSRASVFGGNEPPDYMAIKKVLQEGVEVTVTPQLALPQNAESQWQYPVTSQTVHTHLKPITFKVSWVWVSYWPDKLTALLGHSNVDFGTPEQLPNTPRQSYYIRPLVSDCIDRPEAERAVSTSKKKLTYKATQGTGQAYGYGFHMKFVQTTRGAAKYRSDVKMNTKYGTVIVNCTKGQVASSNSKFMQWRVDLSMTSQRDGTTIVHEPFLQQEVLIQWCTSQEYQASMKSSVLRVQPGGTTKPPQTFDNGGGGTANSARTGNGASCDNRMGPAMAKIAAGGLSNALDKLNLTHCTTGSAGAITLFGGGAMTSSNGCENVLGLSSSYNTNIQNVACVIRSVKTSTNSNSDVQQHISLKLNDIKGCKIDLKQSIVSVSVTQDDMQSTNQLAFTALTANSLKDTASNIQKDASGWGAVSNGSKAIKVLSQNFSNSTDSQSISENIKSMFQSLYTEQSVSVELHDCDESTISVEQDSDTSLMGEHMTRTAYSNILSSMNSLKTTNSMDNQWTREGGGFGSILSAFAGMMVLGLIFLAAVAFLAIKFLNVGANGFSGMTGKDKAMVIAGIVLIIIVVVLFIFLFNKKKSEDDEKKKNSQKKNNSEASENRGK